MFVVDASVWISSFILSDRHHEASQRWLVPHLYAETELAVPGLMLAEIAGAVSRIAGDPEHARAVARRLRDLPGIRLVHPGNELAHAAADLAASLRIRGADATYLAVARRLRYTLVTWDNELRERGREAAPIQRPSDLPEPL